MTFSWYEVPVYFGSPVLAIIFGAIFLSIKNRSNRAAMREPEGLDFFITTTLWLDLLFTVPWLCLYMLGTLLLHGLSLWPALPFLIFGSLLISLPNLITTGIFLLVFTHANDVRVLKKAAALTFLFAGLALPTLANLMFVNSMQFE